MFIIFMNLLSVNIWFLKVIVVVWSLFSVITLNWLQNLNKNRSVWLGDYNAYGIGINTYCLMIADPFPIMFFLRKYFFYLVSFFKDKIFFLRKEEIMNSVLFWNISNAFSLFFVFVFEREYVIVLWKHTTACQL